MTDVAQAGREKKLAALGSVFAALVLVSLKVFLAATTGSLGVLSEALHSGLDLVAAVLTYLSVRVSDKPADTIHTYGHGKVENVSALVETGLLLVTAVYIIVEAFGRLLYHQEHLRPSIAAILILALAMAIDWTRSRALARVARRFQSDALEADALHFSTDVWSTLVVLIGIGAAWLGDRLKIPWLSYADPLAALGVAAVIIWIGSRLGKRTVEALLDAAPRGLAERIRQSAERAEGVLAADRVRVRRAGNRHFVDLTISVPRRLGVEQAHDLSEAVEARVRAIVPADVVVHVEPRSDATEGLFDAIRAVAQRAGLPIHEIAAQQLDGRLFVDLHLEVDERLSLRQAHQRATELEESIRSELGPGSEVNIHIEPLGVRIPGAEEMKDLEAAILPELERFCGEFPEISDYHHVIVRSVERRVLLSCHCAFTGQLPIPRVHDITMAIEDRLRRRFPQIDRVTIHPEPVDEA
ncbi:MAG TPA: cation-efflux pump [Candidatus Dormibacteraeota bacterium]|nr:cation-efflux pump [Candidatus Dormibacteraeota bacterium]